VRVPVNPDLLTVLKKLRMSLAKDADVPAFVIFSDAALVDMCARMPQNEEEFLSVSGVGQKKLEQFGADFLSVIAEYKTNNNPAEPTIIQTEKTDPTRLLLNIKFFEEPAYISRFLDKANAILLENGHGKVGLKKITDRLLDSGYLEILTVNEKNTKAVTDKGIGVGISSVEKTRENGEKYNQIFYDLNGQRLLLHLILEELAT